MSNVPYRFIRAAEVVELVGLSRSTLDRLERASRFPRRRPVASRAVAWISTEIDAWMEKNR
jgi:prophage regulatory protein